MARATTFLADDRGGVEIWILSLTIIGIICTLFITDIELERVRACKYNIKENLVFSVKGAAKRIDFYEASEHKISIESDYEEQFKKLVKQSLVLNDDLTPIDSKDFGLKGAIDIKTLRLANQGHDSEVDYYFYDQGLVAVVSVPLSITILGQEIPIDIDIKVFSEIRN